MSLNLGKIISIEKLNLSSNPSAASESSGVPEKVGVKCWKNRNSAVSDPIPKFCLGPCHLFVARNNEILVENFDLTHSDCSEGKKLVDSSEISRLIVHKSAISCIGISGEYRLLCSCSEDEVILWQYNSKKRAWDNCKIAEEIGKISICTLIVQKGEIFVLLTGNEEILTLKCTSKKKIGSGSLSLKEPIDLLPIIDCTKLQISWTCAFFVMKRLFVVGLSSGNSVSLRIWEVREKESKLIDQKTSLGFRSFAGVDFIPVEDFFLLLIISPEGFTEVHRVCQDGFNLIVQFKMEETPSSTCSQLQNPLIQMDFRILSAQFLDPQMTESYESDMEDSFNLSSDNNNNYTFCEVVKSPGDEDSKISLRKNWNSGEGDTRKAQDQKQVAVQIDLQPEDNKVLKEPNLKWLNKEGNLEDLSLLLNNATLDLYPPKKLFICVATNNGIVFINVLSGDIELSIGYKYLIKEDVVVNDARICLDSNQVVCTIQPLFQKRFLTMRFQLDFNEEEEKYSFVKCEEINPKSILRRTLKASSNISPVQTRAKSRIKSQYQQSSEGLIPKRPAFIVPAATPRGRDENIILPPRIVKISPPRVNYFNEALKFGEKYSTDLGARLSDNLSYLRMASSKDGSYLAAGGSASPLVMMKTKPAFETIQTFRDFGKVTSVSFSMCSKYLLIGTNDCKTTLLEWSCGKKLMEFDVNSKFNEHPHCQFYFMDKFVLQPEENKLVLYSYSLNSDGCHKKLKAGFLTLDCQNITACLAPNQFYSNLVLCAGSNKSLQLLDQNEEKILTIIPQAHSKNISCIRINECPKSYSSLRMTDFFLTSAPAPSDPIKLWDMRTFRCVNRVADINPSVFLPISRPGLSPCGRYICSGCEENSLIIYDVRKINARMTTLKTVGRGNDILDSIFDYNSPMIWCGLRNGSFINYFAGK